jgi:hypothetical protein
MIRATFGIIGGVSPYSEPEYFILHEKLERMVQVAELGEVFCSASAWVL